MSQFKAKKMTFDQYENKLSSKPSANKVNNKKHAFPQRIKLTDKLPIVQTTKLTQKTKLITTVKPEYSQKPFSNSNSRSLNISSAHHSQIPQNRSNFTIINNSKLTNNNSIDSFGQNSSISPYGPDHKNLLKTHQVTRESIPQPISHTSPTHQQLQSHKQNFPAPQHSSSKTQEVNKIDLIFEKQPEDVQKKLRALLLNYNAVMQYNQDQDKFQVDLLLPFNSQEEKDLFVQKFMKTRHYLSQQVEQDRIDHQLAVRREEEQARKNYSTYNPWPDPKNSSKKQETSKHPSDSQPSHSETYKSNHSSHPALNQIKDQTSHAGNKKSPNQSHLETQNILSTSIREETQKIQQEKQLKQTDLKIDFFQLSQSLDLSIQKGLSLIQEEKLLAKKLSNIENQKMEEEKENFERRNIKSIESAEFHGSVQRTDLEASSQIQQQSHVNQFRQPASQIESQISQGIKANVPHSIERNLMNTPSGKKIASESAWMKPLQPNESEGKLANSSLDYSQEDYSRMIKPTGNSLYESPIVPLKNHDSFDRNNMSNEILIEDLESYNEVHGYETPDKGKDEYEMEQESYNSAFDMIEETAEEHEDEHFPSSAQYKQFLKMKIYESNKKAQSKEKVQEKRSNYMSLREPSSGLGYNRQSSSSLRAKYSQFLSKNHKKIENLYLRIGRQIKKKKGQEEPKVEAASEILITDEQIEDLNEKQDNLLEGYKKRIVLENDSMSSEDKVRYFRYLAKHAKGLYIEFIKSNYSQNKKQTN